MNFKEKFLNFLDDAWEYFIQPLLALLIVAALIVGLNFAMRVAFPEDAASVGVKAGVIVDKEYVGPSSGLFREKPAKYYITIESDYEIKTGTLTQSGTTAKTFSVDEETYRKAEMGMWFDTRTMEVCPHEPGATEPAANECPACGNALDADDKFCSSCGTTTNRK